MHLGLKLKILRLSKGLTQEELAEKIHKTRPLVSAIEQTGKVSHQTLVKMCKVLGVESSDLENEVSEPAGLYRPLNYQKQEETIQHMQKELDQLRMLVNSQQDLIVFLKEKIISLEKKQNKKT